MPRPSRPHPNRDMSAVNDAKETMTRMRTLLAAALPLLLGACGGAAPHTGYPSSDAEPWTSPSKLRLKDTGDVTVEGTVNSPARAREVYAVELPAPGTSSQAEADPFDRRRRRLRILDEASTSSPSARRQRHRPDAQAAHVRDARRAATTSNLHPAPSDITDSGCACATIAGPVATVNVTPEQPGPKSVFHGRCPTPGLAQVPAATIPHAAARRSGGPTGRGAEA